MEANIMSYDVSLKQAASKSGGDRYESPELTIYIPQTITRTGKTPSKGYTIIFSDTPSDGSLEFALEKKAAKSGGDKYVCKANESFNIYVPQAVSRSSGSVPHGTLHVVFVQHE